MTLLCFLVLSLLSAAYLSVEGFSTKPYAVNLKFTVKEDRREDFMVLIRDNQRKTLELEPKALQYVVGEDVESPNTFFIHEQFIGKEGFEEHRATTHAKDWASFKNSDPFTANGAPSLVFFECAVEADSAGLKQMPVRPAFCVHAELCIKPEVREEFLRVIENNAKGSNSEDLCLQYSYGESEDTPNKFVFHEEFTGNEDGKEGFEAHATMPHFLAWEEFASTNPFTKPPVVDFYKTLPNE
jgi:quinol monooxygenase YgiN